MEKLLELLKKYGELYIRLAVNKFYIYTPNGQKIKEIKICDFFNLILNNYCNVSKTTQFRTDLIQFEGEIYPLIECYFSPLFDLKKYDAQICTKKIFCDSSDSYDLNIKIYINRKVINYKHIVKYLPEHIKLYCEMNELDF